MQLQQRLFTVHPLVRAGAVMAAVAAMVTGVTFAALNSQATLTNNTVSTASANLVVGTEAATLGATQPGFTVTNLIPGTGVSDDFYLKSNGSTPADVTARIPALPGAPAGGYGFSGFENLTVKITSEACPDVVNTNMLALNSGEVALPCNSLPVESTPRKYTAMFDIAPSAISGSQAGVDVFDMRFTATPVAAPVTTP